MDGRYALFANFFADATALRGAIVKHLSDPNTHTAERHQVWNYWSVPGTYTYLRTVPEKIFGQQLAQAFFRHLQQLGRQRSGPSI